MGLEPTTNTLVHCATGTSNMNLSHSIILILSCFSSKQKYSWLFSFSTPFVHRYDVNIWVDLMYLLTCDNKCFLKKKCFTINMTLRAITFLLPFGQLKCNFTCRFCVTWHWIARSRINCSKIHFGVESRAWLVLNSFAQNETKPFLLPHVGNRIISIGLS